MPTDDEPFSDVIDLDHMGNYIQTANTFIDGFEMGSTLVQEVPKPGMKKDIGEKQIDPDVHAFTNPLVERLPLGRPENPPKQNPNYNPHVGPQPSVPAM